MDLEVKRYAVKKSRILQAEAISDEAPEVTIPFRNPDVTER